MKSFRIKRSKQVLLFGLIIAFFISFHLNATTYYVSPKGDDNLNGTSQVNAWQTISKVNSTILNQGDSVLFLAGGVWRETLNAKPGTAAVRVYYSRYGTGDNPKIKGSNLAKTWTETATSNVWGSATSMSNPRTGPMSMPGEIFFLKDGITSWGDFQTYSSGFTNLTKEFDWTWNSNVIYVYATSDPDSRYDSIEVPQRDLCIYAVNNQSSYMEFDGIDMQFARVQGFGLSYAEVPNQTDLTFKNLTVSYIGEKNGSAAYGIEAFHSNFLVDNCVFSDVGRRSISYNLYVTSTASGGDVIIKNVIVRNSLFKNGFHTTSLDLAMEPAPNCVGHSMTNVYFYNNIIDDSKGDIRSVGSNGIFTQEGGGYINKVYIYNNVFIASLARSILIEDGDTIQIWNNTILGHNLNITTSRYSNVTLSCRHADYRNNINYDPFPATLTNHGVLMEAADADYILKDYNLYYQEYVGSDPGTKGFVGGIHGFFNISQWSDYRTRNPSFDAHSPTPQNPDFMDYNNFNYMLNASSPARGAGVSLPMVPTDILGYPRDASHPSLGAYEYVNPDSTSNDIVQFVLAQQTGAATIDSVNHSINIEVWYGTNVTSLSPSIYVSYGATINPASGVSRNFTSPQTYTITAKDGISQQIWTVTVTIAAPSSETDILTFVLPQQTGASTINNINHTDTIQVAYGTILTNLTPVITFSNGATISPASSESRDFSNPQTYTITAQNGSTQQNWTVNVTVANPPPVNNLPEIEIKVDSTSIYKGFVYHLDASSSSDADNDLLTFDWDIPTEIIATSLNDPAISILPSDYSAESMNTITLRVSDGKDTVLTSINIHILIYNPNATELMILSAEANSFEIGNESDFIIDDDFETRWSAEGDNQWISCELEHNAFLSYFDVSFYAGNRRTAFFDISASTDNKNWDLLIEKGSSCGFSQYLQTFQLSGLLTSKAYKYVRLIGHMNSENNWNSITEFKTYGFIDDGTDVDKVILSVNFEVYPNPATNEVYIILSKRSTVRITNLSGIVIHENIYSSGKTRIDYKFQKGLHFIQMINNEGSIFTKKLIVN